jgi:hypothetical protein
MNDPTPDHREERQRDSATRPGARSLEPGAPVWHLVLHDLASLKPFTAAWVAVLATQALVLWMGPPVPDGTAAPAMSLDVAVLVMRLALTVVFVSALVLRHPVVGTTAFWMTRPIQRADLFASTIVSLGLVTVALPFVGSLLTFWWLGFDLAHASVASLRIVIEQAGAAVLALLLATLTKNLAQAIVTALAAMIIAAAGRLAVVVLPRVTLPFGLVVRQPEWAYVWAMAVPALVVFAIAAHQYMTLRTRRSYVLAGGALVAFLLATHYPIVKWGAAPVIPLADVSLETPDVTLDRASIRTNNLTRMSDAGTAVAVNQSALFEDDGPPTAIVLQPIAVQSRLRFLDGVVENFDTTLVTPWAVGSHERRPGRQPWASMALALGGVELFEPRNQAEERFRFAFLEVRPEVYAARGTQPVVLAMNITLEAYRYEVFVRVPLALGMRARGPGYAVELEGMAPEDRAIWVSVRETATPEPRAPRRAAYVLVNARRKQAVVVGNTLVERFRTSVASYATPFVVRQQLKFEVDPARLDMDADWLKDAELVVLRARSLGRVIRGIHVPDYTLAPPHVAPRVGGVGSRQ